MGTRARPGAGGGRHWWLLGLFLVAVGAGVALPAVGLLEGDEPSGKGQPAPTVTPSAVVLAGDGPSEPGPPAAPAQELAPTYEQVRGMAALGDTLVAVGERAVRPRDERPELSEPLAWWSVDGGERWDAADTGDIGNVVLTGVAADRDRLVAVGFRWERRGPRAVVLVSPDGRSWVEERIDGADVFLRTAVATPAGAVLAGSRNDLPGQVPVVFVPEKDGWRQVVLLGHANGEAAEIRGACADGKEITLVGSVSREGEGGVVVLRSTDAGEIWRPVDVPGAVLVGTDPRANACATAGGRTAVTGTVTVRGYDRAFVSVERDGRWEEALLLEPSDLGRQGHTVGFATVALGREFAVLGYDTSTDNARTDLAAWQSGPGGWVRLDALDALGAGLGVAEARAAVVARGVLVVGGISSDRAVVWRTSPAAAVTPPQVTTTIPTPWWVTHGEDDLCRMAPPVAVTAAVGPVPARPRLLPEPAGPTVSCTWLKEGGDTALQIQIAPARRLDVLAANYPAGLPTPKEVDGVCESGTYYPAFATLVARCGDTAVAVGGLPQDTATILMKVFVEELDD